MTLESFDMRCERCGQRPATGTVNTVSLSSDGTQTQRSERICAPCFEVDRAAWDARQHDMSARLADGSIFEQLRADLIAAKQAGNAEELAAAAEFVDLLVAELAVAVPDDLRAFADRHRRLPPNFE